MNPTILLISGIIFFILMLFVLIVAKTENDSKKDSTKKSSRKNEMKDKEMIKILKQLCDAYVSNNRYDIKRLEPLATKAGKQLNKTGGIDEMRRIFKKLKGRQGSRTLEMHWNGIGDWRG